MFFKIAQSGPRKLSMSIRVWRFTIKRSLNLYSLGSAIKAAQTVSGTLRDEQRILLLSDTLGRG